jgi:ribosomal protein S18 acetylase RimI-like enzyme
MQLRNADENDIEAVLALVQSAYRGESSRAGWTTEADLLDGPRTDAAEIRSLLPHLIVADGADGIVGCCVLMAKDDHAYFGMFAVRPTLQGGGVGSLLLAEAESRAATQGFGHVQMSVLTPRSDLIAFYERRGYTDTGERLPFPHEAFATAGHDRLELMVLRKEL